MSSFHTCIPGSQPEWWLKGTTPFNLSAAKGTKGRVIRERVNPQIHRVAKVNDGGSLAFDAFVYDPRPLEGAFSFSFAYGRGDFFVGLTTAVPSVLDGDYAFMQYSFELAGTSFRILRHDAIFAFPESIVSAKCDGRGISQLRLWDTFTIWRTPEGLISYLKNGVSQITPVANSSPLYFGVLLGTPDSYALLY